MKNTLKKHKDFKLVMNNGRVFKQKYFNVFYIKKEHFMKIHGSQKYSDASNLYGIMTSKKLGGAVVRNRCKRFVRLAIAKHGLNEGYFWVFLVRRNDFGLTEAVQTLKFTLENILPS
jgi:ribonuclease P protein component